PLRATTGLLTSPASACSFWQPRFPKTLNQQLPTRFREPGRPGDPRGYRKRGIKLKQARRRITRLSVTSKVGESGRETAVSRRKGRVLTLPFLPRDDGLVEATKLNKGIRHPGKRLVQLRV